MSLDEKPPPPDSSPRVDATEALARRARDDREHGFGELYARIAPSLFPWASLHLRDPLRRRLDPEDLLQEVCCRAYERFDSYDPDRANFRGWIFGIARNVLRRALREMGRTRSGEREGAAAPTPSEVPDSATSITRRIAREEHTALFLERVQRLPEDERMLLMFRGLEGLPHSEVGKLLGIESKTAAKRWDRLRERLREETEIPESLMA